MPEVPFEMSAWVECVLLMDKDGRKCIVLRNQVKGGAVSSMKSSHKEEEEEISVV